MAGHHWVVALFAVLEVLAVAISGIEETSRLAGSIAEAFERGKRNPAA